MRIKVTDVTQKISFVAVDSTDGFTRETGITAWTVYYSLNGGTATVMTTPTVGELSATNMAGVYVLTVDESGMVSAKGELTLHITATGVAPITRVIEITDNFESDSYGIVNNGTYGNSALNTDLDTLLTRIASAITITGGLVDITQAAADKVWGTTTRALTGVQTGVTIPTVTTLTNAPSDSSGVTTLLSRASEVRLAELDAANLITDVANVKTDTVAILSDTGTDGVVVAAASKTGYTLSAAGIDSILDEVCETAGSYTLRQVVSIILSVLAGVTSNNGATLKTPDGTTTRVAATIDANNNRTAMTLTP